ncbi:MAG TPA: 2-hydroxyacyl-CoA dehydratase family protein, partial [Syntrophorhabdaceae bacterium]|nr:2-hydroxyacyl-CoA dehydratase family protein [Syntrophorhabdaceae bacterium]
ETTCDGKKKMFELISERKPTHIMDLPQLPDEAEALSSWILMIRKLQKFLEDIFGTRVTDEEIETAIKDTNHKNRMIREVIAFAALDPPLLGWQEIYELTHLSHGATGKEMEAMLTQAINKLNQRRDAGYVYGSINAPRVMLTGCPFGGDVQKVLDIVEESGGTIVALESCSGYKPFMLDIAEDTGDPIKALAERYLKIPCSCMTPNTRRLTEIGRMIDLFRPHAVIDLVLQACHSFNIESYKVGEYVQKNIGLPFLKIVTDFSQSDVGQIRTRVEALLESC